MLHVFRAGCRPRARPTKLRCASTLLGRPIPRLALSEASSTSDTGRSPAIRFTDDKDAPARRAASTWPWPAFSRTWTSLRLSFPSARPPHHRHGREKGSANPSGTTPRMGQNPRIGSGQNPGTDKNGRPRLRALRLRVLALFRGDDPRWRGREGGRAREARARVMARHHVDLRRVVLLPCLAPRAVRRATPSSRACLGDQHLDPARRAGAAVYHARRSARPRDRRRGEAGIIPSGDGGRNPWPRPFCVAARSHHRRGHRW